jgi:hypothetical protein
VIDLKYCRMHRSDPFTVTTFKDSDGVCCAEAPDTPWHRDIQSWVGCAGDPDRYNWEHEFCHNFLSEVMWDAPSYVVWMNAHNRRMSVVGAKFEERWCYHFHKYLNDLGEPLEPEWPGWRDWARELLA